MKLKPGELRKQEPSELLKNIGEQKKALLELRVAQEVGSVGAKVSKIKVVRKNIARLHTIYREFQLKAAREMAKTNKTELPKKLRPKCTRASRRELTPQQKALKTRKRVRYEATYPKRNYALIE